MYAKLSTLHEASCAPSMHCCPLDQATCVAHLLLGLPAAGKLLEAVQESPVILCFPSDADKFSLGFTWHMQTPLNCLPDNAAVFFELQHYKLAKKKVRWNQMIACLSCGALLQKSSGSMSCSCPQQPRWLCS
jgi:hypothetical protein